MPKRSPSFHSGWRRNPRRPRRAAATRPSGPPRCRACAMSAVTTSATRSACSVQALTRDATAPLTPRSAMPRVSQPSAPSTSTSAHDPERSGLASSQVCSCSEASSGSWLRTTYGGRSLRAARNSMPSRADVRPERLRPAMSSGPARRSGTIGATASASTPTGTLAPSGAGSASGSTRAGIGGTGAVPRPFTCSATRSPRARIRSAWTGVPTPPVVATWISRRPTSPAPGGVSMSRSLLGTPSIR